MAKTVNIDQLTIEQYLQGKLDPSVMHELEKAALDDPFLADALEGYSYAPISGLSILQRQLEERIARQQENKNIFNYSWQRLSIAATAAVLFVLAAILFWMRINSSSNQSEPATKQVEVSLAPKSHISVEPINGWPAYETYLKQSIGKSDIHYESGKVIVEFTIDTKGELSNFRIKQGLSKALNEEAMRIIKEGPAWKPVQAPVQSQITIDFSTLF